MGETQVQSPGTAPQPGILKRIMSRVRSTNDVHDHQHHNTYHAVYNTSSTSSTSNSNSTNGFNSGPREGYRRRTPSFKNSFSGGSAILTGSPNSSTPGASPFGKAHSRSKSLSRRAGAQANYPSPNPKIHTEAPLSRELWEDAYDSLRLDPSTSSLVVTYESIISQELPDDLKLLSHGTLSPGTSEADKERRMELMSAIVSAKMNKRRGSKTSQASEMPKVVLEHSKKTVEGVWDEFPSAALAWAGICTLTPVNTPFPCPTFTYRTSSLRELICSSSSNPSSSTKNSTRAWSTS